MSNNHDPQGGGHDVISPPDAGEAVEFALDDTLDVERLLAIYRDADAELVRAIVAARAQLTDHLVPRSGASLATVGPLLLAVRALEHALLLALGGEADPVMAQRRRLNAAALVLLAGSPSSPSVQTLRGVGAVADAVEVTLREFLDLWLRAPTTRDVATVWDSAALILSSLLPALEQVELHRRRELIRDAARAFLPQGDPQRPDGEWSDHVAALLQAGGIDVASGASLRVTLHNYRARR